MQLVRTDGDGKLTKITSLGLTGSQLRLQVLNRLLVARPCGTRLARSLLLQLRVLFLRVDKVEDDVETTG